jgi:carboxyl-terminal processing protease
MINLAFILSIGITIFGTISVYASDITDKEKELAKSKILELFFRKLPDSLHHLSYDSLRKYTDPYTFIIPQVTWRKHFFPNKHDKAKFGYGYYTYPGFTELSSVAFEGDAYSAGFVKGNHIVSINGRVPSSVEEMEYLTRGDSGDVFEYVFLEQETCNEVSVRLQKNYLEMSEVLSCKVNRTGIIYFEEFHQGAHSDFVKASLALIPESVDTLVIDLRDNTGGLVREAVSIISEFLTKEQPIIRFAYRNHDDTTKSEGAYRGLWAHLKKVYVITNGRTASASEMLTGVLLTMKKGTEIIGDTTYGKGRQQQVIQLGSEGSYVHVTNAEYFPGLTLKVDSIGIPAHRNLKQLPRVPVPSIKEIVELRQTYLTPSLKAFQDERLQGKEYLAEHIWDIRGELFIILAKELYKK